MHTMTSMRTALAVLVVFIAACAPPDQGPTTTVTTPAPKGSTSTTGFTQPFEV